MGIGLIINALKSLNYCTKEKHDSAIDKIKLDFNAMMDELKDCDYNGDGLISISESMKALTKSCKKFLKRLDKTKSYFTSIETDYNTTNPENQIKDNTSDNVATDKDNTVDEWERLHSDNN